MSKKCCLKGSGKEKSYFRQPAQNLRPMPEVLWLSVVGANAVADSADVIGRGLVHAVVQPVAIEQVGAGAPAHRRFPAGIVLGEVVQGKLDVHPGVQVPEILLFQRVPVILGVAH